MITLVLICIVGIVPVSTLECPQKYGVLRKTADLYTKNKQTNTRTIKQTNKQTLVFTNKQTNKLIY